jgi:hypothetical protein
LEDEDQSNFNEAKGRMACRYGVTTWILPWIDLFPKESQLLLLLFGERRRPDDGSTCH